MGINEIATLIMNNGLGFVLVAYFIFKDYKFNEQILNVLGEVKEVLASLKTWHEMEAKE